MMRGTLDFLTSMLPRAVALRRVREHMFSRLLYSTQLNILTTL